MKQNNIEVEIVADSVNPLGKRIVSALWTYPRFIHAEIMTHRQLSRNAASSRAIPVKKVIEAVQENPAVPEWWGAAQRGMQADGQLDSASIESCREQWAAMRDLAIGSDDKVAVPLEHLVSLKEHVENGGDARDLSDISDVLWGDMQPVKGVQGLMEQGLHKQIANRALEPWFRITVLVTATEWDNFFALRAHPAAQPEFQVLAYRMLDQFVNHKPEEKSFGQWHIPFDPGEDYSTEERLIISVAKSARTSYVAFDTDKTLEEQTALFSSMRDNGHWSPFEHQAMASNDGGLPSGNFRGGWFQHRHKYGDNTRKVVDYDELLAQKPDWIQL